MKVGLPVSVIIDSRSKSGCEGECGLDWSKPANQAMAREEVRSKFGNEVDLTFCDLADSVECGAEVTVERMTTGPMGLPILAINGKPRITGLFDVRMMCLVVEASLENIND
ncbi:MAG: hypothetical protein Q7T05_02400 [Dehalococcoidia bacterium]|nr:hypothetical protein [Dehalococcoidia bacterium]